MIVLLAMKTRIYIAILFFFFAPLVGHGQGDVSGVQSVNWLKEIKAHVVQAHSKGGAFAAAKSGYALYFSRAGNINQPYLVYVPEGYDPGKKAPVVVFLHGAILARDSFRYRDAAIASEPVFSVGDVYKALIVFPFGEQGFMWPGTLAANENIIAIIEQVKEHYNTDSRQIYLGGISMGGIATYWFMKHKPEYFSGFYTFSSTPSLSSETGVLDAVSDLKPLYSMNAKDDVVFSYDSAAKDYESRQHTIKGWYFNSVQAGGHRFIYGSDGSGYIKSVIGHLLMKQ